jgi:hypothetical protein
MLDFYFNDTVNWIKSDKRISNWTTIYKQWEENNSREYLYCLLFPEKLIKEFIKHPTWSLDITHLQPNYVHYSEKPSKYYRWGIESKYEPLVYQQFYNNIYPTKYELIEEIQQFFNLYFDNKTNTYIGIDIASEESEVVKIIKKGDNIEFKIRTHFLRQFLYAKKLVLGFQLDYFRELDKTLAEQNLNENMFFDEFTQHYNFSICFKDYCLKDKDCCDSRLLGKAILLGYESQNIQTDYDKFNSEKCEDFIVNINKDSGNFIYENCNKSEFKKSEYHFYTPVFFKREVLLKYYNSPNLYTIDDGFINMKGSWRLSIDNNNYDFIVVYLGDLRILSHSEQLYWKSFNIEPQSEINKRRFSIDFLSSYYDPEIEDLKFKNEFTRLNKLWLKKFGFYLISEFDQDDIHCFKTIRLPLKNEPCELDILVLNLCKVLIDYLNIKEINKYLNSEQKDLRSIEKFEKFLKINQFDNLEKIISFYKTLQKLRSTGSAHRKNSDYKKVLENLGYKDLNVTGIYKEILNDALISLKILINNLK